MRNSKASGRRGIASIITVLCICFVLAALTGILSSDSIESFREEVTGYISSGPDSESQESVYTPQPALFTFPATPTYSIRKSELTPILRTPLQPGFSLNSNYQTSDF